MKNITQDAAINSVAPALIEDDIARSAWYDPIFAEWFAPFANKDVLFNGPRGEAFFKECGAFVKEHRTSMGAVGDSPSVLLENKGALDWFNSIKQPKLPGGKTHKPTKWQIEKTRRYLTRRHDSLLAEKLGDAERLRLVGENERADAIAIKARQFFTSFTDSNSQCTRVLDDVDSILNLAESNPPLFTVEGELGNLLNPRLKGDNLGVIVANQKIGKTAMLLSLAVTAGCQTPTLIISAGDETEEKIDARIATNLSCHATQPDFAGKFAMPVPDCKHNASGTCPIGMSGEPRMNKDWENLLASGATPEELCDGSFDGSRGMSGNIYQPCCRCFPQKGTKDYFENRKRWQSAVWWRMEEFKLVNRKIIVDARNRYEMTSFGGGLRKIAYSGGKLSVSMIEELLDRLDRTENFVPQVVILDYADLLLQEIFRSTDKDHDGMRVNWERLRAITFERGILLITATQTNRLGDGIETHTIRTIGRCAKAADNATWVMSLNQLPVEKSAKVMRASMMFAREGSFNPEYQALCYLWLEVQDSFAFSAPIFKKTKTYKEKD